ncbi:hypothetical protein SK128_011197 [Halocaridina rubra]|uniref:Uncharacterized protein n=1 Tax=Halocaridina rubra TaxID=373956 RepID=A0AAN9AC14_HALRR
MIKPSKRHSMPETTSSSLHHFQVQQFTAKSKLQRSILGSLQLPAFLVIATNFGQSMSVTRSQPNFLNKISSVYKCKNSKQSKARCSEYSFLGDV